MYNTIKRCAVLFVALLLLSGVFVGCSSKEEKTEDRVYKVLLRDSADGSHYRFEVLQSECEEHQIPMLVRWQESGQRITLPIGQNPSQMTPEQRKVLLEQALVLFARWEEQETTDKEENVDTNLPDEDTDHPPVSDGSQSGEEDADRDEAVQMLTLQLGEVISGATYECSFDIAKLDSQTKKLLTDQSRKGVLMLALPPSEGEMTEAENQALLAYIIQKLKSAANETPRATVFVDAGHGYANSYGVIDKGTGENSPYYALTGKYESDVNLAISLVLKEKLEMAGFKVIMSRESEVNEHLPINDRARMIKNSGADFSVSVHCNSFDNPSVNGARVYWHSDNGHAMESEALAKALASAINGIENTTNREAYATEGSYAVVRDVHIPAVLVETCFLTGEDDAKLASDPAWLYRMAQALFNGIEDHFV